MFALLYTFAAASSVLRPNCASLTTPELCNGKPSSQGNDYVCAWNVRTVNPSCISVEAEEFNLCALYHGDVANCKAQPGCFYDSEDMECEVREPGKENEAEREDAHRYPPVMPQVPVQPAPVQPTNAVVQPSQPAGQPSPTGVQPQPVQPSQPVSPQVPATLPGNSAATQPTAQGPKRCEGLPQIQCFGPSTMRGQLCMWDAEDVECSSVLENDAEAICKQFAGDMQKCDAQLDCFWDAKDQECSEVKQGAGAAGAHIQVSTSCATLTSETACAGTAVCFWDQTLCVNVVQAVNVCQLYTTPTLCSTNALCHWKERGCLFAAPTPRRLRKEHMGPGLFAPAQMGPATGYQPVPGAQTQAGFTPAGQVQQQPGAYSQPGVAQQQPGMVPQQQPGMLPQQQQPGMVPQQQPGQPGAYPQPGVAPQQPGAYPPAAPQQPQPMPQQQGQPGMPPQQRGPYGRQQFCKMLSKQECFGPSLQPGEYCMWDAEDFECSSYNEHDAEGLCKQYGLNPQQCDAQLDCFWDEKDHECTDVKGIIPGRGRGASSIRTTCINYKTAETCAAQASCFWEQAGNQKVCVLASGHWLTQVNAKTADPKAAQTMKHGKTEQKSSSTKISVVPSLIMVILGFAAGVLATLGCRKKKQTDFQTPLDMDYVQQTDQGDSFA